MNKPETLNMKRRARPAYTALCLCCLTLSAHLGRAVQRAGAPAPQQVNARVRQELLAQLLKDRADLVECLAQEGPGRKAEYLANVSVEAVELNGDGRPEYFVEPQGGCDCGAHNCDLFVYRHVGGGYELMLEGNGVGLAAEKTFSNGYADISVEAQGSALTRFRTYYKFGGRGYRESRSDVINMETGEVKPAARRLRFPAGATSAVAEGRATLGFGDTYLVGARAGQQMTLRLAAANKSVTLIVMTPNAKALLADNVTTWSGTLPESGDYRILIDADERGGAYKLTVSIR